jgi:hypothetical protein
MDSKIEDAAPPSDERKCYNCGQVKFRRFFFTLDRIPIVISNLFIYKFLSQPGHISRECPSPRVERTSRPRGEPRGEYTDRRPPRRCFNCGRYVL